jgi:hypothetical protein
MFFLVFYTLLLAVLLVVPYVATIYAIGASWWVTIPFLLWSRAAYYTGNSFTRDRYFQLLSGSIVVLPLVLLVDIFYGCSNTTIQAGNLLCPPATGDFFKFVQPEEPGLWIHRILIAIIIFALSWFVGPFITRLWDWDQKRKSVGAFLWTLFVIFLVWAASKFL